MHATALKYGKKFFDTYALYIDESAPILDIGSQDINGSLKQVMPGHFNRRYVGVDFVEGNNVDVVLTDPYKLPFEDNFAGCIVCSSCFEHAEMFWLTFLEIMRVLKPSGLFYLNAPSNGVFHQFPVDCWRFYPDSGLALVTWARRMGIPAKLLESFVGEQDMSDGFNDFVAVFVKSEVHAENYPDRIVNSLKTLYNWRKG